jgi:hypothetical protein
MAGVQISRPRVLGVEETRYPGTFRLVTHTTYHRALSTFSGCQFVSKDAVTVR